MITFLEISDRMMSDREEKKADETQEVRAIKTGLNVRDDFWDDFLRVLNDKTGLSALLEVSPEEIARWSARVSQYLNKVRDTNDVDNEKTKILDTGMI